MKRYPSIDAKTQAFLESQPIYFVGTASEDARISVSPKGIDSFRVLGANQVAYADMTGSTNEAALHLARDGRITMLFCSFTRNALIVRLYGRGRVIGQEDDEWPLLSVQMPSPPSLRHFILMDVDEVIDNCGFGVPEMALIRERPTMAKWAEKKGEAGLRKFRDKWNRVSIDGIPIEER